MTKQTAVIICPGRGTYNKQELGYIATHHGNAHQFKQQFDELRLDEGQQTISALDEAERFSQKVHTAGDNASGLIFTASLLDAVGIMDRYNVVAVTGNSMGWYTALAIAGAVLPQHGFTIVNTMGRLMQESLIGGQSLYPFVDDDWREIPGLRDKLLELVTLIDARDGHELCVSIHLGGMLVVAGNARGLEAFEADLPPVQGRYPMRLPNHAGFHSAMQAPVAAAGRALLGTELFKEPKVPLIDGRGVIWRPKTNAPGALRDYTLGTQVVETYDFTKAVTVAARSFAPDVFIVTGPGTTLGGAVAQSLISARWRGLDSKSTFQEMQKTAPLMLSMGRNDDRERLA